MENHKEAQSGQTAPGFIDLHVHLRDPGATHKEDIESGIRAAERGGFAAICCMPNTDPVIDNSETVAYVKKKAAGQRKVTVLPVGAITKGQRGRELAPIEEMVKTGICAISEDGKSVGNASLMLAAMKIAAKLDIPVFSHAEDDSLGGAPLSEVLVVARDILLAKEAGCKLHLCHISARGSLALIRKAKAEGIRVTAETAPHYFTLDESCVKRDPNRKMNPPLRHLQDVRAIREALADGTLDAIATDHAPHAKWEKEQLFEEAPNGVIGLETCFAVSYTVLVKGGVLSFGQLMDKLCYAPAKILGIDAKRFAGAVRIDLDETYEIRAEDFVSKSQNSPFIGMRVYGRPVLL